MVTLEELENAETGDLSHKQLIQVVYSGTCDIEKFAKDKIVPIVRGLLKTTNKEKAII
jgi:hypothetical protein